MTYYGSKELAASFRTVRKNTLVVAQEIPEDHYGFSPAPGCRTVAQTLVHMAVSLRFPEQIHFTEHRSNLEGVNFIDVYKRQGDEWPCNWRPGCVVIRPW